MTARPDNSELARATYTPYDVAVYTVEAIEERRANQERALCTGVAEVDRWVKPLLPGEVCYVVAYTSHGKTSWCQFWARQCVRQLRQRGVMDRVVVYVSWETLVEELGLYDLCGMTGLDASGVWYGDVTDAQIADLRVAALRRAAMPLWVVGYSLRRRRELRSLTVSVVREALAALEQRNGLQPAMVFLDYVQAMDPEDPREERSLQVARSCDEVQRLAREVGCPVVVASQAGNAVMERAMKLPEINDGQWTSRQQQDADKVLTLWYPVKNLDEGEVIPDLGWECTADTIVLGVRKQRRAASGQVLRLRFDPARNTFSSWDEPAEVTDQWWD